MNLNLKVSKKDDDNEIKIIGFQRQSLVTIEIKDSNIKVFHTILGIEIIVDGRQFNITWEEFAESIYYLNESCERSL